MSEFQRPAEELEIAEKIARQRAEREAAQKIEHEKAEKAAREKLEHEAVEKAKREKAQRQATQIAALKETISKSFTTLQVALPKAKPFITIVGVIGIIFLLFWVGSWAMPTLFSPAPTAPASITPGSIITITSSNSPIPFTKTGEPSKPPTETRPAAPTALPTEITNAKDVKMMLVSVSDSDLFYMDKYEVTNSLYARCVDEDACLAPTVWTTSLTESSKSNYPVVYVNRDMAQSYCEWRGARLPTEDEWIKAARGNGDTTYPWGTVIDCEHANYAGNGFWFNQFTSQYEGRSCTMYTDPARLYQGHAVSVGSYESGKSIFGIYDLIGNVSEWTNTFPKGGSWSSSSTKSTIDYIYSGVPADTTSDRIGFRCVGSVP